MAAPPRPSESLSARRLATGFVALAGVTYVLIVFGALVRANGAGLACPDWPLCFGEVIPAFDVGVAFEWGHRALAGSVGLVWINGANYGDDRERLSKKTKNTESTQKASDSPRVTLSQ